MRSVCTKETKEAGPPLWLFYSCFMRSICTEETKEAGPLKLLYYSTSDNPLAAGGTALTDYQHLAGLVDITAIE